MTHAEQAAELMQDLIDNDKIYLNDKLDLTKAQALVSIAQSLEKLVGATGDASAFLNVVTHQGS